MEEVNDSSANVLAKEINDVDYVFLLKIVITIVCGLGISQLYQWWKARKEWIQAMEKLPGPPLDGPESGMWTANFKNILETMGTIPGYPTVPRVYGIHESYSKTYPGIYRLFAFNPYRVPFSRCMVFVYDPEFVRQILADKKTSSQIVKDPRIFQLADAVVGNSYLTMNDTPTWKHQRKLTARGMNQKLLDRVNKVSADLLYEKVFPLWEKKSISSTGITTLEVVEWSTRITAEVLGHIAFSRSLGGLDDTTSDSLFDVYQFLLATVSQRSFRPPLVSKFKLEENRKFNSCSKRINDLVHDIVKKRLVEYSEDKTNASNYQDLLSYMIEDDNEEYRLSEGDLFANSRMFLFAGQDTTSATLSCALFEIARNHNIQNRLQNEIDTLFSNHERPAYGDIMLLEYLDAFVKETLRLHSPAGVARRAIADIDLKKKGTTYTVKKGTAIFIFPFFTGLEGGDVFDPDRFLKKNGNDSTMEYYIPFSVGPRDCVGKPMAIAELKVLLTHILHRYTVKRNAKCEDPIKMLTLTVKPNEVLLDFERR